MKPFEMKNNELILKEPPKKYGALLQKYADLALYCEALYRENSSLKSQIKSLQNKALETEMQYCEALSEYEEKLSNN